MRVVELVRRHEMTRRSQPANLVGQSLVKLDRRMEEEVAVREAHYRHPGRERKRQPDSAHSKIFEWAIDDADVRRDLLVDVNWLINRGTHLADRQYPGNVELRRFVLDAYLREVRNGSTASIASAATRRRMRRIIGIGGSLTAPPLPHHRTYGSRIRRFGGCRQDVSARRG